MLFAAATTAITAIAQAPEPVPRGPQAAQIAPEITAANRDYRRGEFTRALAGIEAFLLKEPADPKARFLRGLILSEQSKSDAAIQAFLDMTRDYPELPEPYNNLGVLYAGRGQYAKAREALLAALQANPDDQIAQENLGDVYIRLAIQSYEQALSKNTANRTAKGKLTMLRELATNVDRAKAGDADRTKASDADRTRPGTAPAGGPGESSNGIRKEILKPSQGESR
ncbi:MAG: tetratricopeptide repeat protein [Burkholderiales bacterium]